MTQRESEQQKCRERRKLGPGGEILQNDRGTRSDDIDPCQEDDGDDRNDVPAIKCTRRQSAWCKH